MHGQVLILSNYTDIIVVGLRKIAKNINQYGPCLDVCSNWAIPNTRYKCSGLRQ
jgi:hypothetical protein